jgi:6-phosphogluconolactonase (cycloisomerase 2 family)
MKRSGFEFPAGARHISQRRWFVSAIALVVAIALWTPASCWAASDGDVVYVESNQTSGNSILAFRNDGTGTLTFIGSTPTGGIGVFDPQHLLPPLTGTFDTDQSIQVSADRKLLFAVNSGSSFENGQMILASIAVFHIHDDGSLQAVAGSPFPSGGTQPVSVGLKGDILAVANKDNLPPLINGVNFAELPNYTSFRVGEDGGLTPIPGSTVSVAYNSSPSQALTASRGRLVFGADTLGAMLQSFRIDEDGRLRQNLPVPAPTSVYPPTPLCHPVPSNPAIISPCPHYIIGLQTHPTQPILYAGFTLAPRSDTPVTFMTGKLGVYRYNMGSGKLSFVRAAGNSGNGLCWIILNRAGTRIYTVNTFDNSVSVYDATDPLNPAEIQHYHMIDNTGGPSSLVLDSSERFLYVVSQRLEPDCAMPPVFPCSIPAIANAIHVLKVNTDGKVTEVGPFTPVSPLVNGDTTIQGIAVF